MLHRTVGTFSSLQPVHYTDNVPRLSLVGVLIKRKVVKSSIVMFKCAILRFSFPLHNLRDGVKRCWLLLVCDRSSEADVPFSGVCSVRAQSRPASEELLWCRTMAFPCIPLQANG